MSLNEAVNFFAPSAEFVKQATISGMDAYKALCAEAEKDYAGYWARLAREHLSWKKPFTQVLDESNAPFFKWFADGTLNASYNCLDRNVEAGLGDKVAIVFEADDGAVTRVTYRQLLAQVSQFANGLRARGINKGDRVLIYMSMGVEGIVAMQACARIGAIHSVVFGGFSAQSVRDRINDAGAVAVITADEQCRGGKNPPLKPAVDEAISLGGCESVRDVIVFRRTGGACNMVAGRDIWWHDVIAGQSDVCEPEWV
jgi:acetyl-CoA synthetase